MILSPSLLSADVGNLAAELSALEAAGLRWVHWDVMDGRFVPNITFGQHVIRQLRKRSGLFFDVHLMIVEPENYLSEFQAAGADMLVVEEPWRYGVVVFADKPDEVYESAVDAGAQDGAVLWRRSSAHDETTCRECLLKVSPTADASNAAALFAEASRQGIEPQAVVGNYLLTASDETGRWDCHRAWVVGETPRDPADDR